MRQSHVGGEKLFIDYAGDTVPVVDRRTGEIRNAHIFVAVMGGSSLSFACATWTEQMGDWIEATTPPSPSSAGRRSCWCPTMPRSR
jgi:transposase